MRLWSVDGFGVVFAAVGREEARALSERMRREGKWVVKRGGRLEKGSL